MAIKIILTCLILLLNLNNFASSEPTEKPVLILLAVRDLILKKTLPLSKIFSNNFILQAIVKEQKTKPSVKRYISKRLEVTNFRNQDGELQFNATLDEAVRHNQTISGHVREFKNIKTNQDEINIISRMICRNMNKINDIPLMHYYGLPQKSKNVFEPGSGLIFYELNGFSPIEIQPLECPEKISTAFMLENSDHVSITYKIKMHNIQPYSTDTHIGTRCLIQQKFINSNRFVLYTQNSNAIIIRPKWSGLREAWITAVATTIKKYNILENSASTARVPATINAPTIPAPYTPVQTCTAIIPYNQISFAPVAASLATPALPARTKPKTSCHNCVVS